MSETWRWLQIPPGKVDDRHNMALDEAILESFIVGACHQTVRPYLWIKPCVTLGKNQDAEEARGSYPGSTLIRRPTGGMAVQHGDDLTLSVIASEKGLRDQSSKHGILASYYKILSGVLDTIHSYDVPAESGISKYGRRTVDCFKSLGKCDVVDLRTGQKIVGCAQLRTRGALLQQMSLRPHERYHIYSPEFLMNLKRNLGNQLDVGQWEDAFASTSTECSRSALLAGS